MKVWNGHLFSFEIENKINLINQTKNEHRIFIWHYSVLHQFYMIESFLHKGFKLLTFSEKQQNLTTITTFIDLVTYI